MFEESDYVDDSFLEEIQCDKCPYSFPLYLYAEHELMVHALDNTPNDSEDEEVTPKTEEKDETLLQQASAEVNVKAPNKEENIGNLIDKNLIDLAKFVSRQEKTHAEELDKKVRVAFENMTTEDIVTEEDTNLDDEAVALSSFSSKAKRIEEEKPTFKTPSNVVLKGLYSKPHIRNELTESDNEDGESLEDFWRKADVKIAQRMRKFEEMKVGNKCDNAYFC